MLFETLSPAKTINFTTTVATVTIIKLMVLSTLLAVINLVLEGCSALSLGKRVPFKVAQLMPWDVAFIFFTSSIALVYNSKLCIEC